MSTAAPRDFGQSALSALRADRPIGGRESTPVDDDALTAATLLRHATTAGATTASRRMIRAATRLATALLGRRRLSRGNVGDTPNTKSPLDVFRILAEHYGINGHLRFEDHVLESVERLAPPRSLTQGRVIFRRAILKADMGRLDAARLEIEALLANPLWKQFEELRLRGLLSLSMLAYRRGNFPEAKRFALRVVRGTRDRHPALQGIAYNTLATLAAERGDFNAGLEHAWKAYDLIRGSITIHRNAALNNISQILLDAGYPGAARAGFARMLTDSLEVRAGFAVIGGYAMASAALSDRAGVEWATTQILRLAKLRGYPDGLANALFECSEALAAVGEQARADTLRRRSAQLAEQHGLHQLSFKAQRPTMIVVPSTSRLNKSAAAIALRISEMEPARVPATLVYAD
jgi:hypothetical protein